MAFWWIQDDTIYADKGTGYNYQAGPPVTLTNGMSMSPSRVFHCIVKISDDTYFTGGTGWTGNFKKCFILNGDPSITSGTWTQLPDLAEGRNTPFRGLVTRSNGVQEVR